MTDAAAAAVAAAVQPAWTDLQVARALLRGLPERALLHAGPPLPPHPFPAAAEAEAAEAAEAEPCGGHFAVSSGAGIAAQRGGDRYVLPAPLLHSAIVAVIFEGWADDEEAARRLVLTGGVELLVSHAALIGRPVSQAVGASNA
jgi:hypothetical protein